MKTGKELQELVYKRNSLIDVKVVCFEIMKQVINIKETLKDLKNLGVDVSAIKKNLESAQMMALEAKKDVDRFQESIAWPSTVIV